MQLSNFLRTVLKLDAATCLGTAALVLPTASALQQPFGMESAVLAAAAAMLVPIGLFILWLGTRREAGSVLVWLVILGNFGWAAASLAVAAELPGITALGQAAVAAQGLAVLALAFAEYWGLRQSRAASWEGA
jgi:hypothetical protein